MLPTPHVVLAVVQLRLAEWPLAYSVRLVLVLYRHVADSRKLTLEQMLDPAAMADYQAQRSNEKALVTPQALAASL